MCIYYTFGKLPFMFTRTGWPVIYHFVICVYITHLENCHSCLQGPVDQLFITLLYVYILHIWKIAIHVYKDRFTTVIYHFVICVYITHLENCHSCLQGPVYHSYLSLCYMCIYYTFGKLPFMFTRTGWPVFYHFVICVYITHVENCHSRFLRAILPQLFVSLLYVYILHIWKIAIHVYKDRFTTVIYHFVICVYIRHVENCHSRFLRAGLPVIYHFVICVYIRHVENCHSRFLRAGWPQPMPADASQCQPMPAAR